MDYLLLYPKEVLIHSTEYISVENIKITELLCSHHEMFSPFTDKVRNPVYLSVHPGTSKKFLGVLGDEGFRVTAIHTPKGELYSLYTRLNEWLDLHVRIMPNGDILSEIEPHRYSLMHLSSLFFPTVLPCIYEVKAILDKHRIPYKILYKGKECKILDNHKLLISKQNIF